MIPGSEQGRRGAGGLDGPAAAPGSGGGGVAGGVDGPAEVAALVGVAMDAVRAGAVARGGPLPAGGPAGLAVWPDVLPERGVGAERALGAVLRRLSAGAADPAHPWSAGHLHCAPLAVAAAADLAASVLNQSMDSWDQAPSASALEASVTTALARLVFPSAAAADAVITSGGTESNLLALLLARESFGRPVRAVCGATAHHSVARAAWLLGLPPPVTVECVDGRLSVPALDAALGGLREPAVVVATAGTTETGSIDPLAAIARVTARHDARRNARHDVRHDVRHNARHGGRHGGRLHVDAAYGGGALFSDALRPLLDGMQLADTVGLDLHKFGWQPIAAGVLAVRDAGLLAPLATTADYLNAADDTEAGLPDLLGRSLRTSRRADVVKIAATFAALGRCGLAALVEHCCATAASVAARVAAHPRLLLWAPPALSTVVFRPSGADDASVARTRRTLLDQGRAVLGRAVAPDPDGVPRLWLKLTLLHPTATADDYAALLDEVATTADAQATTHGRDASLAATTAAAQAATHRHGASLAATTAAASARPAAAPAAAGAGGAACSRQRDRSQP